MAWILSRFRAGDLVEVRGKEEILATLDEQGCVDGMPFMPEMLRFCGQRFHVRAVAHKTCETARHTYKGRRLGASVHLEDIRCDGSAHGGCEAACTLFWKDVWLKPVEKDTTPPIANGQSRDSLSACSDASLIANARSGFDATNGESCYVCQATKLYDA